MNTLPLEDAKYSTIPSLATRGQIEKQDAVQISSTGGPMKLQYHPPPPGDARVNALTSHNAIGF